MRRTHLQANQDITPQWVDISNRITRKKVGEMLVAFELFREKDEDEIYPKRVFPERKPCP